MKYIIHAEPIMTSTHIEVDLQDEIEDLGQHITKSFNKRVDEIEFNRMVMMKQ